MMKKKFLRIAALTLILALSIACTGCKEKNKSVKTSVSDEKIFRQNQLKESKELTISEDGTLEVEIDSLAKPDAQKKSVFLAIQLKEDADIAIQYTYDTYGKEGAVFCCDVKDSNMDETEQEPVYAMRLVQSSEENYGEIWQSGGIFLKKGTNLFYLNGGDQTLPYHMTLKLNFFDPQKIESVVLYPTKN